MSLKAKIEAVLFLTSKPIKAQAIARIINADVQSVRQALLELVHDYEERKGGLEIADDDGYSFQVREEFASLMDEFLPIEMSAALIRTLSAIAIKQPVMQSEIIRVRGAGAYDHIRELVSKDLISKKDEQGERSPMLATTKKFQEYFKLSKDGKDLRNFLKRQVKKADAAAVAAAGAPDTQLVIPDVVTQKTDEFINSGIYLETADPGVGADAAELGAGYAAESVAAYAPESGAAYAPESGAGYAPEPAETILMTDFTAEEVMTVAADEATTVAAKESTPAAVTEATPAAAKESTPAAVKEGTPAASVNVVQALAPTPDLSEPTNVLKKLASTAAEAHEPAATAEELEVAPAPSSTANVQANNPKRKEPKTAKTPPSAAKKQPKQPPSLFDLLVKQKQLEKQLKIGDIEIPDESIVPATPIESDIPIAE